MGNDNREMRLGLYRKIEVARKKLPAMDEVAFRALLRSDFGVESRKDMSLNQLSRLVRIFAEMGVDFRTSAKSKGKRARTASRADFIEITDSMPYANEKRQILAIWRKLGYSISSLDTRVKRAFGAHFFIWLQDGDKIRTLLCDLQRREKAFEKRQARQACQSRI